MVYAQKHGITMVNAPKHGIFKVSHPKNMVLPRYCIQITSFTTVHVGKNGFTPEREGWLSNRDLH